MLAVCHHPLDRLQRRRSLRLFVLAFVAGLIALQLQPNLPQAYTALAGAVAMAAVLAALTFKWPVSSAHGGANQAVRRGLIALSAVIFGAALGFGYGAWRAEARMADALDAAAEGRDIALVGKVRGLPQKNERGVRFTLDVESVLAGPSAATPSTAPPRVPLRLSLTWYHEAERRNRPAKPAPTLAPGERWQLTVRLRQPHGFSNPHGFDSELWALERNLRATGYVRTASSATNQRLAAEVDGIMHRIDRLRATLAARIIEAVPAPHAGVLVALTIGEQNAISQEQWRTFWRTGVGVGAATATLYALVAGFSVPTQRTLYMILVVAAALALARNIAATKVLAIAVMAVLVIDPWAVLSPGFWLSFGAVAAIFYLSLGRRSPATPFAAGARTQLAISVLMVPAGLVLFQEVSLVSPIANALAIPLVSLVVVPLALAGAFLNLSPLLAAADLLLSWLMWPLTALAALPAATWQSHAPHPIAALAALVGGAWLLAPRAVPMRGLALPLLLPIFLVRPAPPAVGTAEVTLLDVGQGLAIVIRTASHALVYDTGASFGPDSDVGSRVLVPYLRGEGITRLDTLVVTHDDDDHYGGAVSLINARKPAHLYSSLPRGHKVLVAAHATGTESKRCEAGQQWEWNGVRFEFLHPSDDAYAPPAEDERAPRDNDMGCVLEVTTPGANMLLTADIEALSEAALTERLGRGLQADVLLVPHHGSKTSSTADFLDAVRPELAVVSVGYRNRFRHPHPDVLGRYVERGIPLLRTDSAGALRFTLPSAAQEITATQHRLTAKRYWRGGTDAQGTADE
jgi:competence protein ComEC